MGYSEIFIFLPIYSFSSFEYMNCLSDTVNIKCKKFRFKLLQIINGVCGIFLFTYLLFLNPSNQSNIMNLLLLSSAFYVTVYTGHEIKKEGVKPTKIYLFLFNWMLLITLTISISLSSINSLNYPKMIIGILPLFLFLWYTMIKVLNGQINIYIKIFLMLFVYIITILIIAIVFAPASSINYIDKNFNLIEVMFYSLRNSYSLPDISKYDQINIIHIVQFLICKIFDVIILGTEINLISNISKNSNG